jgi:hypothetical protein
VALAQPPGGPGGGDSKTIPPAGPEVTLTINPPTVNPTTFKLTFTGTFGTAEYWSVGGFKVVLIPSGGGISRTYPGAGTGVNAWSATTTDPIAPGSCKAFVIANGTRIMAPADAGEFCSSVITVTNPAMPGGVNNPTVAPATYGVFTFTTGLPVRLGAISAGAAANAGNYQLQQNEAVTADTMYLPVMNILPVGGGKFYRFNGTWDGPPPIGTSTTGALPATPLYNVYMHFKAIRTFNGVVNDSQLITTIIKPNI